MFRSRLDITETRRDDELVGEKSCGCWSAERIMRTAIASEYRAPGPLLRGFEPESASLVVNRKM